MSTAGKLVQEWNRGQSGGRARHYRACCGQALGELMVSSGRA